MLTGLIVSVLLLVIAYFLLINSTVYKKVYGNEVALKFLKRSYRLGAITKEEYNKLVHDLED
jgi:uncharacterized membrane protein